MPSPLMMHRQVAASLREIKAMNRPKSKGRFVGRYPLIAERGIVVLWAMYRGWSDTTTARAVRTSDRTVRTVRNSFYNEPGRIFRYPVLHQGLRRGKPIWTCLFCGDMFPTTEKSAREHVAFHIMAPHIVKALGVETVYYR